MDVKTSVVTNDRVLFPRSSFAFFVTIDGSCRHSGSQFSG